MADKHSKDEAPARGYSSFREAREAGGNSLHGAHTLQDSIEDKSMDPQPLDLPAGTGSAAGKTIGAVAGAVVGGAAGVIAGPIGIAAGAAAGAAAGGMAGGGAGEWADQQDDEDLADKRLKGESPDRDRPTPQDTIGAAPDSSMQGRPRK